MGRLIDGKPGFIINRNCYKLRKSLGGGYHYKRVAIGAGHERFKDSPNKNEHSHVGDAAGYCLLGSEHKIMTKSATAFMSKPTKAKVLEFDVFG
jgi:hypothetical protein